VVAFRLELELVVVVLLGREDQDSLSVVEEGLDSLLV
jgi:hypothetical protein